MNANEKMMSELSDSTGVYIAPGTDAKFYLQCLSDDIIKNKCEPFLAKAVVVAPGFPDGRRELYRGVVCRAKRWVLACVSPRE